jgi:hypothetical protein
MARSTYFDLGRSADACLGSESGYAQRFQCGNIVKRLIWTRMLEIALQLVQVTISRVVIANEYISGHRMYEFRTRNRCSGTSITISTLVF